MTENRELTKGDLLGPMVALAWPMIVIQLLQVAYNVADTFWLGALSADAVGALSLAFPIIFLLISVGGGFTAAGAILVAQHTGAGGDDAAGKVAGQTLTFVLGVSVVLAILGFLVTDTMLGLFPADPETKARVIPLAADYMRLFFLGSPALFGFFVFVSLLRGYGNTRTPMRIMFVSVVVNVVIDPLLIFGFAPLGVPAMGIEGAAVATVLSRAIAAALGFYVLFGTTVGPTIERAHLVPDLDSIAEIVRVGVPSALEQSMASLAMVTLTAMIATFPPAVVAAYGLGNRLISLVFLPAMGLGQATNTVVGQNLGADNPERAARATWLAAKLVAVVMVVVAVVALAFAEPIVAVFLRTESATATETVRLGAEYLRVMAVAFSFVGAFQVFLGAFRGAGDTKTALAFSAVALWAVRVPVTFALAIAGDFGATGIWIAVAVGDVVGCLAAMAWFTRGTWKKSVVDDETTEADGTRTTESTTADDATGSPNDPVATDD
ncbi:MATE family efflux transporter [Halorubellus salinus]|uniref:MATE family efflux transporter n=1 Tax=Halorubellus salinus TaxID=755309 RepID=UPI001D096579|nr:MATE family efflux transporter [Halorubellus salinus]